MDVDDDKNKDKCNHCSQVCDKDGNVNGTSMKQHSTLCNQNPKNLPNNSEDERKRKALAKMIILDKLPLSSVQTVSFKRFMEALCPDFTIPSPLTIARDCCEYYLEKKKKLKKLFTENKQRVCLTIDIWTSEEGLDYMCLTAQFIDDDWNLHNKMINFKLVDSDDGEEIGSTIIECLKEWGIENVLTITIGNASSSDDAISFLKSKLPNLFSDGKYLHIKCMTHIINLVVKAGFKSQNNTIERIRSAVRYISVSPDGLDTFKSCVVGKKVESETFFCLDWPDRWNTTSDMLKRASEFEKAFELFETKDPDFKRYLHHLKDDVPSRTDWIYARKFASLLDFFKRKTMQMSSTTYVTTNQFFSEVMDIDAHLLELNNETDSRFKRMANTMREMFDGYWGDRKKNCMFMYFAVILDPRMKVEVIKYGFTKMYNLKKEPNTEQEAVDKMIEDMVKDVVNEFGLLFKEYESMYQTTSSEKVEHLTTELQKYLNDATIPYNQEFDILQWWKLNASRYPTLSRMAKDILAIPLSTVATESAFRIDKQVLASDRSSLPAYLIEALICTHDWIRSSRKDVINEDLATSILDDF
ncbi:putative HAT dimerization domain, ribonuclease H-like superfamily, hAT-like transposase, RNase-H [Helianthus annuus]|nr:putative HAT dimerization domain, ribonuclease H-like superfamily, hAT-like transposase, RNase-H [Helianthus annuus]